MSTWSWVSVRDLQNVVTEKEPVRVKYVYSNSLGLWLFERGERAPPQGNLWPLHLSSSPNPSPLARIDEEIVFADSTVQDHGLTMTDSQTSQTGHKHSCLNTTTRLLYVTGNGECARNCHCILYKSVLSPLPPSLSHTLSSLPSSFSLYWLWIKSSLAS